MTVVKGIVLVLHLLGMAAILGGWFATRHEGRVHPAMLWGARAQILTGLILVGIVEATADPTDPPNHPKVGVKLLVALAVVACMEIANARQRRAGVGDLPLAGGGATTVVATVPAVTLVRVGAALTLLDVLVAVLWN